MMFDLSHHGRHIGVNLSVGESHHPIALTPQPLGAFKVPEDHIVQTLVNPAVHLDHELAAMAGEIDDVRADGRLSPNVRNELPQRLPEALFRWCHRAPKPSSASDGALGMTHALEHQAFPPCWAT
jgi:hypothetical protein